MFMILTDSLARWAQFEYYRLIRNENGAEVKNLAYVAGSLQQTSTNANVCT